MALAAGVRCGPYEITAKIGAGGMGEKVYRARDTKLDRDVALKILPEAFASDPERLARFERDTRSRVERAAWALLVAVTAAVAAVVTPVFNKAPAPAEIRFNLFYPRGMTVDFAQFAISPDGQPIVVSPSFGVQGPSPLAAWPPDGTILFAPNPTGPLFRVPATGGQATAATRLEIGWSTGSRKHRQSVAVPRRQSARFQPRRRWELGHLADR